jgi:hypothetical protein
LELMQADMVGVATAALLPKKADVDEELAEMLAAANALQSD